jgi:hypothetical protein
MYAAAFEVFAVPASKRFAQPLKDPARIAQA